MPVHAMGLLAVVRPGETAWGLDILAPCADPQVQGINTRPLPADVIHHKPVRNGRYEKLIRSAVGTDLAKHPVPILPPGCHPLPTTKHGGGLIQRHVRHELRDQTHAQSMTHTSSRVKRSRVKSQ